MLSTAPVDLKDNLTRTLIVIGDDFNNDRAKKLLAGQHGHPWRVPGGIEIVCEPDKIGY